MTRFLLVFLLGILIFTHQHGQAQSDPQESPYQTEMMAMLEEMVVAYSGRGQATQKFLRGLLTVVIGCISPR